MKDFVFVCLFNKGLNERSCRTEVWHYRPLFKLERDKEEEEEEEEGG